MSEPLNHQEMVITMTGQEETQQTLEITLNKCYTKFLNVLVIENDFLIEINAHVYEALNDDEKEGQGEYNIGEWMLNMDMSDIMFSCENDDGLWSVITNNQLKIDHARDAIKLINNKLSVIKEHNHYLEALIHDEQWPAEYELSVISQQEMDTITDHFRRATKLQFNDVL